MCTISLQFRVLKDNFPRIDVDESLDPSVLIIKEENHVVVILAVKIFLIFHRLVVFALDEKGEVNQRNGEDVFAGLWWMSFLAPKSLAVVSSAMTTFKDASARVVFSMVAEPDSTDHAR